MAGNITILAETNSNDFGRLQNYVADSNSNFVVVHLTVDSVRFLSQETWSRTASPGKANDWRNREHAVFDLISSEKWLEHVIIPRGPFLWEGEGCWCVCGTLKPPPRVDPNTLSCVDSSRP